MKTKLLALIALAGGSLFAQSRFSVGVSVGNGPAYRRPVPIAAPAFRPRRVWVAGHWDRTRFGRTWVPGHYVRAGVNPYRYR